MANTQGFLLALRLISNSKQRTYSLLRGENSPLLLGIHNQPVRRMAGNCFTGWTSKVCFTSVRSSSRCSINHRATPAHSLCDTASSHSFFAVLRHWFDRFSAASSRSCSDWCEHSSKYSRDGNVIGASPVAGLGDRFLRQVGGLLL
jgi:hypothetical protein